MSVLESQRLSDAVTLHTFTDPRFKTMKVSVNLFLPLEQATAARNAIFALAGQPGHPGLPRLHRPKRTPGPAVRASLSNSVRKMGTSRCCPSPPTAFSRYALGARICSPSSPACCSDVLFDPLKDQEGPVPRGGLPTGAAPASGNAGFRVQRQDGLRPTSAARSCCSRGRTPPAWACAAPGRMWKPWSAAPSPRGGRSFCRTPKSRFSPGRLRPGRGGVPRPVRRPGQRHSPPACLPIRPLARPAASPRSSPCPSPSCLWPTWRTTPQRSALCSG